MDLQVVNQRLQVALYGVRFCESGAGYVRQPEFPDNQRLFLAKFRLQHAEKLVHCPLNVLSLQALIIKAGGRKIAFGTH